jgi:hypothetical protein
MEATEIDVLTWTEDNSIYNTNTRMYAKHNEYLFVIFQSRNKNHGQLLVICKHLEYANFGIEHTMVNCELLVKKYVNCRCLEDAKAKAELFILKQIKK